MTLRRIPGGDFYITCVHIKSIVNPKVFVAPTDTDTVREYFRGRKDLNDHLRRLFQHMRRKIDKTGNAKWFMICHDCVNSGNLENGAPYDMRRAYSEITLGI